MTHFFCYTRPIGRKYPLMIPDQPMLARSPNPSCAPTVKSNFMAIAATMTISLAADSFGADWRASAGAAGPAWKATATGLEAKGPRYYD